MLRNILDENTNGFAFPFDFHRKGGGSIILSETGYETSLGRKNIILANYIHNSKYFHFFISNN